MSLFDDAARFAVEAHADMTRKGGGLPYILHPFEVATIAASMTSDEEVLAAALLHDVVEDAGVDFNELRERFGNRVADLVASETENKYPGSRWSSWQPPRMMACAYCGSRTSLPTCALSGEW